MDAALAGQGIGRRLVTNSLVQGKRLGFRVLQFNAVLCSNAAALQWYDSLGFVRVGTVPGGFRNTAGAYEDIVLMYRLL